MSQKVKTFFELLRGIYGAGKYESQWPDSTHEEAAMILWSERIESYTEAELKSALDNAMRMSSSGEKDWQWPNIGLILSGVKAVSAHKPFLIPRDDTPEDIERRKRLGKHYTKVLMDILNDKRPVQESESDNDSGFW